MTVRELRDRLEELVRDGHGADELVVRTRHKATSRFETIGSVYRGLLGGFPGGKRYVEMAGVFLAKHSPHTGWKTKEG